MLTEYTTPGESVEVRDDESIYSLLTGRIARTGEDTVIAERKTAPGQWTKVTTGEFHNAVLAAAKGLIAFGINKGDAVTIFSTTRYEWGVLDFALAAIGAVNVPIYDTDSAAQAERILNDSDVKLAIADNRERFDRLDSVIDRCPSLKHILMLDSNAMGRVGRFGRHRVRRGAGSAHRFGACRRSGHHRVHVRFDGSSKGCRAFAPQFHIDHARGQSGVA